LTPVGWPGPESRGRGGDGSAAQAAEITGLCFLDHVIVTETAWEAVPLAR
jgi:hypothetical protein